jgi:molybdate transport system ATP-binding protein
MIRARILKHFPAGTESSAFTLDIEFEAATGVTVLFGASGSGKTLTLDAIAGFVRPDEGRILLDEEILFDGAAGVHLRPRSRHCGYVFQNYALFPHMTLRRNLEFAAARQPRLERHRKVTEMLERFRLAKVSGRRPREVSGGEKQRCTLARALIGAPRLLLLDEPARGLDAPLRAELYSVLRQVREEFRTPILLVTHDLEECFELGEEMLVLHNGKLVQSGTPRAVLDQPANVEVAKLLGQFNLLQAEIRVLDPGNKSSVVRVGEFEIAGPYFPGRLRGDRVWLFVRPEQLRALPRDGRPGPNQMAAELTGVAHRPRAVRLEFRGGISVEMPRVEFEKNKDNEEWVIEFPPDSLGIL